MDDLTLARVVHVASVVLWIGGVYFVTCVVMPAIRKSTAAASRLSDFHALEARFSWQARIWVVLAGTSGLWMIHRGNMWSRFLDLNFWWMHAMVALWIVFAMVLFAIEPIFLHRRMMQSTTPEADFARMESAHRILLILALISVIGAAGGSHGLL